MGKLFFLAVVLAVVAACSPDDGGAKDEAEGMEEEGIVYLLPPEVGEVKMNEWPSCTPGDAQLFLGTVGENGRWKRGTVWAISTPREEKKVIFAEFIAMSGGQNKILLYIPGKDGWLWINSKERSKEYLMYLVIKAIESFVPYPEYDRACGRRMSS